MMKKMGKQGEGNTGMIQPGAGAGGSGRSLKREAANQPSSCGRSGSGKLAFPVDEDGSSAPHIVAFVTPPYMSFIPAFLPVVATRAFPTPAGSWVARSSHSNARHLACQFQGVHDGVRVLVAILTSHRTFTQRSGGADLGKRGGNGYVFRDPGTRVGVHINKVR